MKRYEDLISRMKKASMAVYLVTDEHVAENLSELLREGANSYEIAAKLARAYRYQRAVARLTASACCNDHKTSEVYELLWQNIDLYNKKAASLYKDAMGE